MKTFTPIIAAISLLFITTLSFTQELSPVWPKPGKVLFDAEIEISWNPAQGAVSYNLEVFNNEDERLLEINVTDHFYQWSIPDSSLYLWRVQVVFVEGISDWTTLHSFSLFNPQTIEDLVLWLNASTVETESGLVTQWTDLSGNEHHVNQSETGARPLWVDNAINGQPALRFNGSTQFLDGGNILNKGLNSRGVFIVAQANTIGRYISKARGAGTLAVMPSQKPTTAWTWSFMTHSQVL